MWHKVHACPVHILTTCTPFMAPALSIPILLPTLHIRVAHHGSTASVTLCPKLPKEGICKVCHPESTAAKRKDSPVDEGSTAALGDINTEFAGDSYDAKEHRRLELGEPTTWVHGAKHAPTLSIPAHALPVLSVLVTRSAILIVTRCPSNIFSSRHSR